MRDAGHRTPDAGHRTSDGEKSKNNISTPQGGGHNSNAYKFWGLHWEQPNLSGNLSQSILTELGSLKDF